MITPRILLAATLALGLTALAACEQSDGGATPDVATIDGSLVDFAAARTQVIEGVAAARQQDLVRLAALDRAAARHAMDLAGHRTVTHIGQDGTSPLERSGAYGAQLGAVSEHIFRIEGEPTDLADRALAAWTAPLADNPVLHDPATHIAVAFAESEDGGYVGVLLLAQR